MDEMRNDPAGNAASPLDRVMHALRERDKELRSIYTIEEILRSEEKPFDELLRLITEAMPSGWQYPQFCQAAITFRNRTFGMPGFYLTPWMLSAPIYVLGEKVGSVSISYTRELPRADEGPFLKEERQLIETIAQRIGHAVLQRELRSAEHIRQAGSKPAEAPQPQWRTILDLLKRTDLNLFKQISRKLLNYLSCNGIAEAKDLLRTLSATRGEQDEVPNDENRPLQKTEAKDLDTITEETFTIAAHFLVSNGF